MLIGRCARIMLCAMLFAQPSLLRGDAIADCARIFEAEIRENVCSAVETSPRAAELQRNSNDPEGRSGDKAAWQNFCRENFAMSVLDFGIIRA